MSSITQDVREWLTHFYNILIPAILVSVVTTVTSSSFNVYMYRWIRPENMSSLWYYFQFHDPITQIVTMACIALLIPRSSRIIHRNILNTPQNPVLIVAVSTTMWAILQIIVDFDGFISGYIGAWIHGTLFVCIYCFISSLTLKK